MSISKRVLILAIPFIIMFSISNSKVSAQGEEGVYLSAYGTYVFDAGFDSYYDPRRFYDGTVNGGLMWGVGAEYRMHPEMGIELLYMRQDTEAPTRWADATDIMNTDFDLAVNYIMLGGLRHFPLGTGSIEGDLGIMAGAAILNAENPDTGFSDSVTKFAWSIKGGLTFWTQGPVGIRMQAQLLSPVQGAGGGLFFGTGGGGVGVSTYSTLFQFNLGGGVVIHLN